MPSLDSVLALVTRALEGIPVTLETSTEEGRAVIRIDLGPVAASGSESSASAEFEPVESAPSTVSATTAVPRIGSWWLHPEPAQPGPAVLALASQLRASGTDSTHRIRIAYLRGRQGASILRGDDTHFSGPRSQLQNRCYVVLRARDHPEPFFTWNLATHQAAVRPPPGDFDRSAVSHGFASQAEARAFCLGAGLPDLASLRP